MKDLINLISLIWTAIALIIFVLLLFFKAPYGKHLNTNWKPLINNRLGWFLMEFTSFAVIAYFLLVALKINRSAILTFIFLLWLVHYFHRTFIYPFKTKTKHKKIPLLIVIFGMIFNLANAFLNGYYLSHFFDSQADNLHIRFVVGTFVFVLGMVINIKSDYILISLRNNSGNEYKIPRGWLFEFVSCPNYLGEIMEWTGFAILAWNLPALSFAVWTIANLLPRALATHKWYKEKFSDYPPQRKAIIPFIL